MQRVTIVGGAGDMARVVARDLLARRSTIELVLADRDVAKAQRVAAALGVPDLRVLAVDVFEPARVREVIHGSALVVNATGPYFRTGPPVLEACLDERVAYLDLGDDFEAADVLLAFDRAARVAGVTALVCAGLTPGLWNVLVRSLVDRLERVERIALAWVTGSTPKRPGVEPGGRAVLEHMLHEASGMSITFHDGRRSLLPAELGCGPPSGHAASFAAAGMGSRL
jgi:saccharopine dehydrogenase-like NADP-dependent oxidoreductase